MENFKEAFEQGIKHANETAENEKEINQVLEEFTTSISQLSDGKLTVTVEPKFDPQNNSPFGLAATAALLTNTGRHYEALVVKNSTVEDSPEEELCEWKLSEKGYPVRISYQGSSPSCGDKQALVECLAELISKPRSGKIFKKLMDL
tara:strand:+ start:124 stop:564 length:441 start_codon:yes stop_codon:yes gene_type:complete